MTPWVAIGAGTSSEYDPTVKLYGVASVTLISADFSATPTSGTIPLEVQFSDLSTENPTSWLWHFGDGDSSMIQKPFAYVYGCRNLYRNPEGYERHRH